MVCALYLGTMVRISNVLRNQFSSVLTPLHLFKRFVYLEKVLNFHSSNIRKVKKTRLEKKYKNIIQYKPKSKLTTVQVWRGITISEVAANTQRDIDDVLVAASYVENNHLYTEIDSEIYDRSALLAVPKYLGFRAEIIGNPHEEDNKKQKQKDIIKGPPPDPKDLVKRPPVVTIMGHVDHGKTTLLDALRHSSIVSQEHGGITQHIGAFIVKLPEGDITFLDTPGHAAFRVMRARGAQATDIVVLVVAADDGIMEQTLESVRFAREANVPIIVAINKVDKPVSDIEAVKQGLLTCGLQVEDLGGDVQAIPISALKKTNLGELTAAIIAQAELISVSGDPKGPVEGLVLEASMDPKRGKIATALIQRGTMKKGMFLVAGTSWAKVRHMYDEHGQAVSEVTPGKPVRVLGWKIQPTAGDIVLEARSEPHARQVVHYREAKIAEEKMEQDKVLIQKKLDIHLEQYRHERELRLLKGRHRKERKYFREKEIVFDDQPFLAMLIKADVHGSVEAIVDVLSTYRSHAACRLDILDTGVGHITANDVSLAEMFQGLIYAFNLDISNEAKHLAEQQSVPIKSFNVIYHLIDDLKVEISRRLPLVQEEDILGEAIVLQEFSIKEKKKKIPVAGCKCTKGILKRNALCKLIRSEKVIFQGVITSLRHEKTDVESVKKDVECGVMIENPEIFFQSGDTITCYTQKSVAQVTDWDPGF